MNDIIKIIKLLEDSGVLIDGISEMGKHEIKQGRILAALLAPLTTQLVQRVISSIVKCVIGRRVPRVGRGYMDENVQVHSIL